MLRPNRIAIYGLFLRGVCLYVGQTVSVTKRKAAHRIACEKRRGKFGKYPDATFRVLRWVKEADANRVELSTIAKYWRIGQAVLNKRLHGITRNGAHGCGYGVRVKGIKEPFWSMAAAGRAIGTSGASIKRALKTDKRVFTWTKSGSIRRRSIELLTP